MGTGAKAWGDIKHMVAAINTELAKRESGYRVHASGGYIDCAVLLYQGKRCIDDLSPRMRLGALYGWLCRAYHRGLVRDICKKEKEIT